MIRKNDKEYVRDHLLLKSAADLLLDKGLVWSDDFERIRLQLALWLKYEAQYGHKANPRAIRMADQLMEEEYDLTTKWWKEDDA